jgi:hypothetical protein
VPRGCCAAGSRVPPSRDELAAGYPSCFGPPPLDDTRPKETSWTYFKKALDARASKN